MATEKVELTKLKLDNLRPAPPGERYEIADTHVSGLRVRVGDTAVETGKYRGKAAQISFVLLARFPSKPNPNPTRRTLGSYAREYAQLTLEGARQKAVQWKAMIVDQRQLPEDPFYFRSLSFRAYQLAARATPGQPRPTLGSESARVATCMDIETLSE
ncbi:MAG: DUF4102 domain-containing protein [Sphingobacteriales bacterium]|nr:MAG: DUF4102 domain-containing protein [Sphingobacteriales bacterium]